MLGLENVEALAGHSPSPEDHIVHCTNPVPELDIGHPHLPNRVFLVKLIVNMTRNKTAQETHLWEYL